MAEMDHYKKLSVFELRVLMMGYASKVDDLVEDMDDALDMENTADFDEAKADAEEMAARSVVCLGIVVAKLKSD